MKILVLLSRVPYPLDKGDKLRAYNQIKRLSKSHEIILCCLNDSKLHKEAITNLKQYCTEIEIINLSKLAIVFSVFFGIFSNKPLQVHYFYHRHAQKKIDKLIEKHLPKHIYCQLIRVTEYVKKYTVITKTLDYMDALSIGAARRATNASLFLKIVLKIEAKRLSRYEKEVFGYFNNKTIISEQDKALISHLDSYRDEIKVIPNGVDTDFFHPMERKKDFDLVFTGNMQYPPNVESAKYIVKYILPLLKSKYNGINILISGVNPVMGVRALQAKNIKVTGWVEDIRESYARARIFIAPMQTGTGLQNKLLEAMAMKIPCITSALANNALGAIPGKQALIGTEPAEYATHVIALLENDKLYTEIAENGYRFVIDNYNWDSITDKLNDLIEG